LVNNAFRELMAQLKDFQAGTAGDNLGVGGNLTVTGTTTLTGAATLAGRAIDAFPSGTKMLFQQTSAPVGWTKDTTHDNKALRVVSGTARSGGSINFTTAFASQNVGATTLTEAQIPGHTHAFSTTTNSQGSHTHTINDPGHTHTLDRGNTSSTAGSGPMFFNGDGASGTRPTLSATTGISINSAGAHTHTLSGTTNSTGGGASHTHSLDLAVSYVDVIVATKS
jgi:hypothetical protein